MSTKALPARQSSVRFNPVLGPSPLHFDRNIQIGVKCITSGRIVAVSAPCLSPVEAERIMESTTDFFEIVLVPVLDGETALSKDDLKSLELACA